MRFREVEMALQFPMLQHLQRDYPYLFSLAVRTNPFDSAASVPLDAGPTTPAAIAN